MLEENLTAGILVENTHTEVPQEGLVEKIIEHVNSCSLDIFLGPEWLFMPNNRLYAPSEKEIITERIAEGTKSRDTLIIPGSIMWEDENYFYNTSPIISRGKLIGEYHKQLDGGDSDKTQVRQCKKKQYSQKTEGVFNWKNYRIGLEICADSGILNRSLKESKKPLLDLYFLVSCGITLCEDSNIPIKEGGYGLCSDGSTPYCIVYRKKKDHTKEKNEKLEPKELQNLRLYSLIYEDYNNCAEKGFLENILSTPHRGGLKNVRRKTKSRNIKSKHRHRSSSRRLS